MPPTSFWFWIIERFGIHKCLLLFQTHPKCLEFQMFGMGNFPKGPHQFLILIGSFGIQNLKLFKRIPISVWFWSRQTTLKFVLWVFWDHSRFGKSLAKLRSRYQASMKRSAKVFLKDAVAQARTGKLVKTSKEFHFWMKHAELGEVFDYLT